MSHDCDGLEEGSERWRNQDEPKLLGNRGISGMRMTLQQQLTEGKSRVQVGQVRDACEKTL